MNSNRFQPTEFVDCRVDDKDPGSLISDVDGLWVDMEQGNDEVIVKLRKALVNMLATKAA
jgi:hypothetical protein